ncbi:uncharacterized protein DSM5745_07846 [Aspergillus mulundensis]|uniref:Conidiation-specific protein 13 n=1 Tax=Aspergillus mulundensis TaxID=1810919 RepID=A0A3D8RFM1_9EURO|nr:Uncharacterized protein DSM5745_07846 [Aspergillus mulundensis]RDW72674.1 Uncharacterized protein DSM5745_07846 [Aspergillus mulundensis]
MLPLKTWATLALLPLALAQLDKPIMSPAVPFDQMDTNLYDNLKSTPASYSAWDYGYLPARCHDVAESWENLSPYDMEVYNVTYEDCDRPWVMCRHKEADLSLDQMIDNFGRLPVRMRNLVRTQLAFPGRGNGTLLAYTFTDLGDIVYTGDLYPYIRFWIHEVGHIRDAQVNASAGDYSSSTAWLNEYNKDAYICDAYAQTNHAENFAQEVVVAAYDKVVPGGIASLVPNYEDIYNQFSTVEGLMGDELCPGGTCERLFEDDRLVCVGPEAGCASKREYLAAREARLAEREAEAEAVVCSFEH